MRILRVLRDRWRAVRRREDVTGEIHDELAHHEDMLAARLEGEGLPATDARAEARRRLGNRPALQDAGYDVRGGGHLETLWQDLRYGIRMLRARPTFTLVAVLTLALGIGANTAIFSVASGVLLQPLPYPGADRLAMVWMDNARIDLREDWHSFPDYMDYRDHNSTFGAMAAFNRTGRTLTGEGDPERLVGAHSTASLFDVFEVRPQLGRVFTAEEETAGAAVALLSHDLWQRRFGGRPDIVGHTIELADRAVEVIGVMPPTFAFPAPDTAFWAPTTPNPDLRAARGSLWLQMVGRRRAGVTAAQAQADLEQVNARITEDFPERRGYGVYVVDLQEQLVGRIRPAVMMLLGAVGFVLLIACTNVANLLLARAASRERELALRAAIGAGRGRLIQQLLTESVLISVLGGVAGLALGWAGLAALLRLAPADLPRLTAITIDGQVLAFTAVVSLGTGLLFGLAPALHTSGTDPGRALKDGGRTVTGHGSLLGRMLVVAEVALAVVLLVGAGLMLRSFSAMQQVDLGMRTDGVLSARLALLGDRYEEGASRAELLRQVVGRASALPGVVSAGAVGTVFLSPTPNSANFSIEGRPDFSIDEQIEVPIDSVTPNYFDVMGVPLLAGRAFDDRDVGEAPMPVIINQTMARMFWSAEDPIGRRIKFGRLESSSPWMTIVGVVGDTRRTGYESVVRPETYLPHAQAADPAMTLVVRLADGAAPPVAGLRALVRELDPRLAVQSPRLLHEVLADMTAERRLSTTLLAVFAALAAVLAGVGIYGVMAHAVSRRHRELGVRRALGAPAAGILGLVLRDGLRLVGVGLAVGLVAAVGLGQVLSRLLYETSATDPATFAAIAALAIVVAVVASLVPALRAVRVDPLTALRAD